MTLSPASACTSFISTLIPIAITNLLATSRTARFLRLSHSHKPRLGKSRQFYATSMTAKPGDGVVARHDTPNSLATTVAENTPTDPASQGKENSKSKDKKAEKERQRALKAEKLAQKQTKAAALQANAAARAESSKKKADSLPAYVEKTPAGDKKVLGDLADPHHAAYHPAAVESAWYSWWEKSGFFQPKFDDAGKKLAPGAFVIPIPPPNVTGALHCGHALGTALQDVLIRWHRMRGFSTLFVPGCDHASISTQSVIENMLWRKERKTRHDLGREKFLDRALEWKADYHGRINKVLRRLVGLSLLLVLVLETPKLTRNLIIGWVVRLDKGGIHHGPTAHRGCVRVIRPTSRRRFRTSPLPQDTMGSVHLKSPTLVPLPQLTSGIRLQIYREKKFVNWSVQLNTTISNLEVETKELPGRTLLNVPGYDRVSNSVRLKDNLPLKIEAILTFIFRRWNLVLLPTSNIRSKVRMKPLKLPLLVLRPCSAILLSPSTLTTSASSIWLADLSDIHSWIAKFLLSPTPTSIGTLEPVPCE